MSQFISGSNLSTLVIEKKVIVTIVKATANILKNLQVALPSVYLFMRHWPAVTKGKLGPYSLDREIEVLVYCYILGF